MQPRDAYDAQYEFQLQLLIQSFCAEVVDDASVTAGRPQTVHVVQAAAGGGGFSTPRKAHPHIAATKGHGGGGAAAAGMHSARGVSGPHNPAAGLHASAFDNEWNVSSGTHTPTPNSGNQTPSASQRRQGNDDDDHHHRHGHAAEGIGGELDMSEVLARHRLSCDTSLWELTRAADAILEVAAASHQQTILHAVEGVAYSAAAASHERHHESTARFVAHWCRVAGPFFDTPTAAKAFLQQVRLLQLREEAARNTFAREVVHWWRSFHRAARPLHAVAHRMREGALRLWYREDRTRLEIVSEEEVARAVLVYVHHTATRGTQWTKAVYLGGEAIAREEKQQRGALIHGELRLRAELTAAHRLFAHFPAHRRWELIVFAEKALHEATAADDDTHRTVRKLDGEGRSDTLPEDDRERVAAVSGVQRRPASSLSWSHVGPADVSSIRFERPSTAEPSAYRHFPEGAEEDVNVSAKAAARVARLTDDSRVQADRVRATSANLLTRLAKIEAQDIAVKRRTVHAVKAEASRRREDIVKQREARHAALRAASRVETLAYEWQSYVARHPQAADAHQSLLVGSPAYVEALQGRSAFRSVFGHDGGDDDNEPSRPFSGFPPSSGENRRVEGVVEDANMESNAAATPVAVLASSHMSRRPTSAATSQPGGAPKSKSELAEAMLASIPSIPKCRLTAAQRRTLSYCAALRRKVDLGKGGDSGAMDEGVQGGGVGGAAGAVRSVLQRNRTNSIAAERVLAPASVAAVSASRRPSSAAHGKAAEFGEAPHPQQPQRSRTPPLDPSEEVLLTTCESVFANMKRRPYVYPQPPPLLYAEDGSDAIQGRNLLGDDVDLHLLSPLERILRWNMRAQLALRNDQVAVAEGNLKNAMAALHSAEKARRRAARRRSQQQHQQQTQPAPGLLSPLAALSGSTSPPGGDASLSLSGKEDATATGLADLAAGASASIAPAPAPSVVHDLSAPFVYLGLQNMKMLTYTNMAFLCRANGRVRDGLQHLHTVLQAQEEQQSEMNQYRASTGDGKNGAQAPAAASSSATGGGRRSVMVVSPRSADETAVLKHMVENNYGVQADTLLNVSALLLQMNNIPEATLYARRAVELLTSQALRENAALMASDASTDGLSEAAATGAPAVVLQYRPLFLQAVSALHNVAMAQAARPVASANDVEERRVGKATHAAALSLGRAVLGCDHALVARVEGNAKRLAQMLSQ